LQNTTGWLLSKYIELSFRKHPNNGDCSKQYIFVLHVILLGGIKSKKNDKEKVVFPDGSKKSAGQISLKKKRNTLLYVEIKCQLEATDEFLLQILLLAQHVSGTIMLIIRNSRVLYRLLLPVIFGALVFKLSV
jgi:hypothetical protein